MKKILAAVTSSAAFLSLSATVAFADTTTVDLCTGGAGSNLNVLCNINGAGTSTLLKNAITIAFVVAVILALAFLIYGGFKWILSGGDKTKVEEARKHIVAAIIGLVIVFLSYFILSFISQLFGLGSLNKFTIPSLTGS